MKCDSCKATQHCGSRGSIGAPILVVGMSPGHQELEENKPFVGKSGALLWKAFFHNDLSPSQAYCINTINCWPTGPNGKIAAEQFASCSGRFSSEVQALEAHVVLCLGEDALRRVTGLKGSITRWRGHIIDPGECVSDVWLPPNTEVIIPSLHPSYIMRKGLKPLPFLFADVERVGRALKRRLNRVEVTKIHATGPLNWWNKPFTFDVETPAGVLDQIGFANDEQTWTHEWKITDEMRWAFGNEATLKIAHNISFDVQQLRAQGLEVKGPWWDTMWGGHMVQPDLEKNLDTMSSLYLDCPRWKQKRTSDPDYYNAMDNHITHRLEPLQRAALKDQGQLELFEHQMACLPILVDMAWQGVRVDPVERERLAGETANQREALAAQWETLAPGVNPNSPKQLAKFLYGPVGIEPIREKGKITTKREKLAAKLRSFTPEQRKLVLTLFELKQVGRLLSTYFKELESDIVHPSYVPKKKDEAKYGTATGRLSCQDPNIQNQPKGIRSMFVPHEPGNVMVVADWSQIEAFIAAALSGDAALDEALRGDLHAINSEILGCDRTRAKNFYYGTTYLAGPVKIHETLLGKGFEIEYAEVKRMMTAFRAAYPRLFEWRESLFKDAATYGYAVNCFGRRRYFYDAARSKPEIAAFHPSSNAADCLWKIMKEVNGLAHEVGGHAPLFFVHDEIGIETEPGRVEYAEKSLREIMEQEFSEIALGFRVPAKVGVGRNWKDAA